MIQELSYGTRIHLWGLIVQLLTLAIQPGISFATKRTWTLARARKILAWYQVEI